MSDETTRPADRAVAIEINDLSVVYPPHGPSPAHTAIEGLTMTVRQGEVVGVLGDSGSGKSTLARILSGNAMADRGVAVPPMIAGGDALVLGHSIRHLSRREFRRLTVDVGLLPQEAGEHLDPTLSVFDAIAEPILARDPRFNRRALGVRVAEMLDAVHLSLGLTEAYPYQLSSGQRQRVALARSLVLDPVLLIADEPTAGIDVTVREAIVDLLRQLRRDLDFSALVISSDLGVVQHVCNRVAVLHQGQLVGLAPFAELIADPWHPYVEGLRRAASDPSVTGTLTAPAAPEGAHVSPEGKDGHR